MTTKASSQFIIYFWPKIALEFNWVPVQQPFITSQRKDFQTLANVVPAST